MIDVLANKSTQHRRQLRKYLLGKLPEDQATQLDTRLFADDTLRQELEEEQESLVEDFVYGRLAADEHETFQTQCAQAESLREKVGSLRALVAALDRSNVPSPAPIAWKFKRISSVLLPALALVLCCVFLYVHERHKSATFVTPTTSTVATTHPAEPHPSNMSVVAFLSANVVRGPASVPEIKLPQSGTVLELQVEVRTNPSAPSAWDIVLLRGGEMIQSSNNVPLHRLGRVSYLSLAVDVAYCTPAHTVSGIHQSPSPVLHASAPSKYANANQRRHADTPSSYHGSWSTGDNRPTRSSSSET